VHNTAVLGASGYTGSEVVRLLACHPNFRVTVATAERHAGESLGAIFPHLAYGACRDLVCTKLEASDLSDVEAVFCCLPHGLTQEVVAGLPGHVKVVDLSADFRLRDVDEYAKWYGHAHLCPDLQETAVYGLTEFNRDAVRGARLVANPGCYPTCSTLPLVPLLRAGLISHERITIDAKSGISGAGRAAKEAFLFTESADGFHAYGVGSHRHMPEIEQGLRDALGGGVDVTVSFTPHLMAASRGMLCTTYVDLKDGVSAADLRAELERVFEGERFVRVLPAGVYPQSRHVRGSNYCLLSVAEDRIPGRAILISAQDNLVKGASGQALQNMNLMFGLPEDTALQQEPMFP